MQIQVALATPGNTRFEIVDAELDATPRAGEVLLAVEACGICHTDLAARDQHLRTPLPAVLGHEGVGTVLAVGPGVEGVAVGTRAIASFGACGACSACRGLAPAYCRHGADFGLFGRRVDGGPSPLRVRGRPVTGHFFGQSSFASHAIVAARNLVPIAADLPPALAAPLACSVQTGMGAVLNVLRSGAGDTLVVLGGGGVGLAALMAARIAGCRAVAVVDREPARLALARELGATHTVDTGTQPLAEALAPLRGPTQVLDTTGAPTLIEAAWALLRPRGTLVCAGIAAPAARLSLDPNALVLGGRSLRGTVEGDADPRDFIPRLLAWQREGRLPLERVVSPYPFAAVNDALADLEAGRVIKPVLLMH